MTFTIPEMLRWWRSRLGRSILLPTPPACARLVEQARATGIPVGTLYIVTHPLTPESWGRADRSSGDLCCHYDAGRGEAGQRDLLQCLLLLLASLQLPLPSPQTLEEEADQRRQTIWQAWVLARQWGYAALLTREDRAHLLRETTHLLVSYRAAGALVGHSSPVVARQAYLALQEQRTRYPLLADEAVFAEALRGECPQDEANDILVDFDRTFLRACWLVTSERRGGEAATFGDLTIPPGSSSAQMLRAALARAALRQIVPASVPSLGRIPRDSSAVFRLLVEERDLALLIRLVNAWLIETVPQATVGLRCRVYGNVLAGTHIYHLSLEYQKARAEHRQKVITTRDLWVLVMDRRRVLEGAWQRFLLSWLTWSDVQCENLAAALPVLWCFLQEHDPAC